MNDEDGGVARTFGLEEGEGAAWWWLGITLATIKATGKETDGRYTLVEVLEPDGVEAPLHVHHREDEAFWILEGELTFLIGEETIKASPGSYLFGPKDVPHRYTVDSGPARMLFLLSPPGFEELIYATSGPAKALTLPPHQKVRLVRQRWSRWELWPVSTDARSSVSRPRPSGGRVRSLPPVYSQPGSRILRSSA